MLIHDFSDNSLCKVKTDNADTLKIANYALTFWADLHEYSLEDENRQLLKAQSRLYERTQDAAIALKNGLISLLAYTVFVQLFVCLSTATILLLLYIL